jgi:copper chaperone CopZ
MQEIVIEVVGMTCEHCERHVSKALAAVPGVLEARASHSEGQAVVTGDPTIATSALLKAAVREAGYEPGELHFPE